MAGTSQQVKEWGRPAGPLQRLGQARNTRRRVHVAGHARRAAGWSTARGDNSTPWPCGTPMPPAKSSPQQLALGVFVYLLVAIVFFNRVMATPEQQNAAGLMTAVKVTSMRLGTIALTVWL